MKTGAIVAIVVGVIVVLYFAVSRGLIGSGVAVGPGGNVKGIVAPQPSSNYSGYLAATTAPQVSGLVNTLLTGINGAAHSWLAPATQPVNAPAQARNVASPSGPAQPSGPIDAYYADLFAGNSTPIGPVTDPSTSFNATPGTAFDYSGLASDNAYDPNASLELVA